MNPFFLGLETKNPKDVQARQDERKLLEKYQSLPTTSLALRLGRLLIRMGSKLAHEDKLEYPSKPIVS